MPRIHAAVHKAYNTPCEWVFLCVSLCHFPLWYHSRDQSKHRKQQQLSSHDTDHEIDASRSLQGLSCFTLPSFSLSHVWAHFQGRTDGRTDDTEKYLTPKLPRESIGFSHYFLRHRIMCCPDPYRKGSITGN